VCNWQRQDHSGVPSAPKYIIHAVGPVWEGGDKNEAALRGSCYRASLDLAQRHDVRSIAFPAISCGAYRFPLEEAASIAILSIRDALVSYRELESLFLVAFENQVERALQRALADHQ
jgi:O-acetyl-ADP-ribose deacetylase (regulator of RNase III)